MSGINGRLFFRQAGANEGFLLGVISLEKRFPLETFLYAEPIDGGGLAIRDMALPFPDSVNADYLAETPVGDLLQQSCWRRMSHPGATTFFVRKTILPERSESHWVIAATALRFDKNHQPPWTNESLLTFSNGRVIAMQDVGKEARGTSAEGILHMPWWGPKGDRALRSSMHVDILEKLSERENLLCIAPKALSDYERGRLDFLNGALRTFGTSSDPGFIAFANHRRRLHGPYPYLSAPTRETLDLEVAQAMDILRDVAGLSAVSPPRKP